MTTTPRMQRAHFALIARVLHDYEPADELDQVAWGEMKHELSTVFACALHPTNPNFNRARFLAACGVEE